MKLRLLIFVTLFLPVLLFLTPWVAGVLYRPELRGLNGDWNEHEFETYGDDASLLRGTVSQPMELPRGRVLLLASSNLDRDWTQGGKGFPVGRILARRLAGLGFLSIRFDQRGTGKTRQSGRNYGAPENQARDARRVLEHLEKTNSVQTPTGLPFLILAHGDGCAVALRLLNRTKRKTESVLFTGCSVNGNLLDQWLGRILSNMQRVGVAPELQEQARMRIAVWRARRPWLPSGLESTESTATTPARALAEIEKNDADDQNPEQHPDIQALDQALAQMIGERLIDFTRQADQFDVAAELGLLMAEPDVRVLHLLGERDLVMPAGEFEAARTAASSLQSRYPDRYRFRVLSDTDHFLANREANTKGSLFILLGNLSPFRRISPAFLAELDDALGRVGKKDAAQTP